MGIQVLPEGQGGFGASFGQGLGQGISQQIPEEVKRIRLKSGLENLANQDISDPIKLISNLATIPGLDPGLLGVLAPLLQNQLAIDQQLGGNKGNLGAGQNGLAPGQNQSPANLTQGQNPNQINFSPQGTQAPPPSSPDALANNLLRYQRSRFNTVEKAVAEQEKRYAKYDTEFDDATSSYLLKEGVLPKGGEIGGDVLRLLKQKGRQELDEGRKSAETVANEYAQKVKQISKGYQKIRDIHRSTHGFFNRRATLKTIDDIRDVSKMLTDLGIPDDQNIDHLMTDLNTSRGSASWLFNDLRNEAAGSYLRKIPNVGLLERAGIVKSKAKSPDQIAKDIAPMITNNTPIGSVAFILKEKNIDYQKVLSELRNILGNKLNTSQLADISNQDLLFRTPNLDEVYLLQNTKESQKARKAE